MKKVEEFLIKPTVTKVLAILLGYAILFPIWVASTLYEHDTRLAVLENQDENIEVQQMWQNERIMER